ncbi:ABC transporter ATP-binding protein, partial [Falsarthrobacter nasiphocae]
MSHALPNPASSDRGAQPAPVPASSAVEPAARARSGANTSPARAADRAARNGEPILSVRDLNVRFSTENGTVHAVRGISFDLRRGQVLGIVGESGSGKSVTSLAIMGLLSSNADVEGSIKLNGTELVGLSDKQMSKHRGKDVAMVFQDPLSSLTPVLTIGQQLMDAIGIHHRTWTKERRRERAVELLTLVGIPSPKERLKAFPHEFSGGMRQRVMIAIAIANEPKVLICDEPTTALDVTIQAQILEVLKKAQHETGAAMIMITHDLGVVAGYTDDVVVMYAGKPIETGSVDDIFYEPRMPYTMGLLASVPRVDRAGEKALVPIHGAPPNLLTPPVGCSFAPRCPMAQDACRAAEPELATVAEGHRAACLRSAELAGVNAYDVFTAPEIPASPLDATPREHRPTVLELRNVKKHFPLTKGALVK